jgi:sensor histidine kinase YesM
MPDGDKLDLNVEYIIALRVSDHLLNDYSIQPMLLIPFVENAFKHGIDVEAQTIG